MGTSYYGFDPTTTTTDQKVFADPSSVKLMFLLDTSNKNGASKFGEFGQVLREIVSISPPSTQFDINVFHTNSVTKLASSQPKGSLNFNNVVQQLVRNGSYNNTAAVYDAWGQVLNEIPYQDHYPGKYPYLHIIDLVSDMCSLQLHRADWESAPDIGIEWEGRLLDNLQLGVRPPPLQWETGEELGNGVYILADRNTLTTLWYADDDVPTE
jgi:hypothetical protein